MKLFCCLTESHQELFNQHFAPSVKLSGLDLQPPLMLEQRSSTGTYRSKGFNDTCRDKVAHIVEVCTAMRNWVEAFSPRAATLKVGA